AARALLAAGDARGGGGVRRAGARVPAHALRRRSRRAEPGVSDGLGHALHSLARRPQPSPRRDERLEGDRARRERAAPHPPPARQLSRAAPALRSELDPTACETTPLALPEPSRTLRRKRGSPLQMRMLGPR